VIDAATMAAIERDGLQATLAPQNICFGCGHANAQGLRLTSFPKSDDEIVAHWRASPHHQAFRGVLNGGIVGALLDCHSNWAAAWHLLRKGNLEELPSTVTAEYAVKLRRPTPADADIELRAWVVESGDDRATIDAELSAGGKVCATCRGVFVAVKPGHPAYHRWQ
jgi:acyl-coenzyme A thioesterase PaaI-like protein